MPEASFTDPALGKLTWGSNGWRFIFPLARGRSGRGTIIASSPEPFPAAECLAVVHGYIRWFRPNEARLRSHIADKMFDGWRRGWYDPEIDRTQTRLGFQRM